MKISDPKYYNRLIILLWCLLWSNLTTQYWSEMPFPMACLTAATFLLCAFPFVTYLSTVLLRRAARTAKWRTFSIQFLGMSLLTGTVLFGFVTLFAYLEKNGIFTHTYFNDDFLFPAHEFVNVTLSAIMVNFGFCGMRFIEINIRLQQELHESQLQTLSGQINPHSMFNILNHIHVLLEKDPAAADDLLLKYSDILRYQLYNASRENVTIRQDTDYMKQYIEVEKIRWKNKITVATEWNIENEERLIPPLLFVIFLENAFKYVSRSDSEKGSVAISFSQSGDKVSFHVSNSKSAHKMLKRKGNTGLGLPNIRKRLNILYPGRHELVITDSHDHYSVQLTLNL